MIQLLRVDDRLVHGQIALAWTNALAADCIFVLNDEAAHDRLRASMLKMAVPAGIKFVIKTVNDGIEALNSGKTDRYRMLVVVGDLKDALHLIDETRIVASINLGNLRKTDGRHQLTASVFVTDAEIRTIRAILARGVDVECRAVPSDNAVSAATLL